MLGTSTDHRRGEEELLRRIVTRTDAYVLRAPRLALPAGRPLTDGPPAT